MSQSSCKCALDNIKKGQRMTVMAISACGSTGSIVLKDDGRTYATLKKTSMDHTYMFLGQAAAVYDGGKNLRLEMDMTHISYPIKLKPIVTDTDLVSPTGKIVGTAYTVAVEDWTDDDYNDIVITVLATNK